MATVVVRPTSFVGGASYLSWGNVGSNSAFATAMGDNSDTTWVTRSSAVGTITSDFALPTPTITAGEFVARAGMFVRWKNGGDNGTPITEYLGGRIWITANGYTQPFYTVPDGRWTITTTEVGVEVVNWQASSLSTLRCTLYDYRSSSAVLTVFVYDIGANLYTIATATQTLSNTTVSNGNTKPTIAVSTTVALDWEASANDPNLRKTTTEFRVESGGSGVGTGTLISSTRVDTSWSSSGTANVNVTIPDALPNGTYNIYARNLRYRENQTYAQASGFADQYSAWSSATLTMSNPLPTAPTITATSDQTNDLVTVSVTPVATSGFTSPIIELQRSSDSGVTWTTVRGSGVAGTFGSATNIVDYECPRNASTTYRARCTGTYTGGVQASSAWASSSAVAVSIAQDWNIKVPGTPSLNMLNVQIVDKPKETLTEDIGVFRSIDRRYPVVVAGSLGGWDGQLIILTTTAAQWLALKAILEAQKVVYVESPFLSVGKYLRIVSGADFELAGTLAAPRRRVTVEYVEVQAP